MSKHESDMPTVPASVARKNTERRAAEESVAQPETQPSPSPDSAARQPRRASTGDSPVETGASTESCTACTTCAAATMASPCALHQQEVFFVPHAADAGSLIDFLGNDGDMLIAGQGDAASAGGGEGGTGDVVAEGTYEAHDRQPKPPSLRSQPPRLARTPLPRAAQVPSDTDSEYTASEAEEQHNDDDDDDDDDDDYEVETNARRAQTPTRTNKRKKRQVTSKYLGVCWYKRTKKWVCQIKIDGKRKHIGYFSDEDEAGAAYDKALLKLVRVQRADEMNGAPKARKRTFNNEPKELQG